MEEMTKRKATILWISTIIWILFWLSTALTDISTLTRLREGPIHAIYLLFAVWVPLVPWILFSIYLQKEGLGTKAKTKAFLWGLVWAWLIFLHATAYSDVVGMLFEGETFEFLEFAEVMAGMSLSAILALTCLFLTYYLKLERPLKGSTRCLFSALISFYLILCGMGGEWIKSGQRASMAVGAMIGVLGAGYDRLRRLLSFKGINFYLAIFVISYVFALFQGEFAPPLDTIFLILSILMTLLMLKSWAGARGVRETLLLVASCVSITIFTTIVSLLILSNGFLYIFPFVKHYYFAGCVAVEFHFLNLFTNSILLFSIIFPIPALVKESMARLQKRFNSHHGEGTALGRTESKHARGDFCLSALELALR